MIDSEDSQTEPAKVSGLGQKFQDTLIGIKYSIVFLVPMPATYETHVSHLRFK